MKVVFLTEGGKSFGFGHLTRCLALYQSFRERNITAIIIVNGDSTINCFLKGIKYKKINWIKKQKSILEELKDIDIAVIDSYIAPLDFYKKVSKLVKIAVYIDDYKRFNYPKGIVVNPSIYGDSLRYPKREDVSYLLGNNYTIVQRKFREIPKKKINKEIKKVLITLGGKDNYDFINKLVSFLKKKFDFEFILVDAQKDTLSTKEMLNLMLKADICISGGGQTTYELARVGVPTIGICFADNQRGNLEGFRRKDFLKYAGNYREKDLLVNIEDAIRFFQSQTIRERKSIIGRGLIDAKGAGRVVDKILTDAIIKNNQQDFYLRRVNKNDCRDLWLWRNHPEIRKYSFSQEALRYKDHNDWFDKKLKDKKVKMYIAENRKKGKIGQIRFESNSTQQACINVNLNPKFFNKGLGGKIIEVASKKFMADNPKVKEIIAEILRGNIISIKAFRKAGYIFSHSNFKKNRKAIIFKLVR